MVLNKDRPWRKEDCSSGAYKSQGFSEARRRWEAEFDLGTRRSVGGGQCSVKHRHSAGLISDVAVPLY